MYETCVAYFAAYIFCEIGICESQICLLMTFGNKGAYKPYMSLQI